MQTLYQQIIADDRCLITYRPKLNKATGSVLATILLQQILYWWNKNGRQPFYKFNAPCKHDACKDGDSWREELGFGKHEFSAARSKIAAKLSSSMEQDERDKLCNEKYVVYWTDQQRLTWYQVNEHVVERMIHDVYGRGVDLGKAGKRNYEKPETGFTYITETTTETTENNNTPPNNSPQQDNGVQITLYEGHPSLEDKPKKKSLQQQAKEIYEQLLTRYLELFPNHQQHQPNNSRIIKNIERLLKSKDEGDHGLFQDQYLVALEHAKGWTWWTEKKADNGKYRFDLVWFTHQKRGDCPNWEKCIKNGKPLSEQQAQQNLGYNIARMI